MGVVALGSVRSCGVTTLAAALAATWPDEHRALLIELDPAGGTLAAQSGWPPEPSLVTLAASARHAGDPALAWEHCHILPGGAAVVAGPASAEQAYDALGMLAGLLGRLGEIDADVLVDCGRLDRGSPMLSVWQHADRAVLAVRPRLGDLQALVSWLESHGGGRSGRLGLVSVGDGPYPDAEIAEALGVEVLARLPWDPATVHALFTVPASAREVRVAPLVRSARTLAEQLAGVAIVPGQPATEEPPPGHTGSGHGGLVSIRRRVWRAWRPEHNAPSPPPQSTEALSAKGNAPEEVAR